MEEEDEVDVDDELKIILFACSRNTDMYNFASSTLKNIPTARDSKGYFEKHLMLPSSLLLQ
jgi:hypothetical protein